MKASEKMTTAQTNEYEAKMLQIITDTLYGDNASIQLPVKAAKKLIGAMGRIPVGGVVINDTELKELMDEMSAGIKAEKEGELMATMLPDGTRIRAFVY